MRIAVLNGPNLNLLGVREPDVYGSADYASLVRTVSDYASQAGAEVIVAQTNSEGGLVGMIQRWFERGLTESPEAMARIMTVLAFVRPGDLYGQPIDINVPEYGMKLLNLQLEDAADTAATVESNN